MIPTGKEHNFLSEKSIKVSFLELFLKLKTIWDDIFIQVAPDWQTYSFEEWLHEFKDDVCSYEIYFSSHVEGFDYIEQNGLVGSTDKYKYFMLEIIAEKNVVYQATVTGKVGLSEDEFGEFRCEIFSEKLVRSSVITPEGDDSMEAIVDIFRDIQRC